MEIKDFDVSKDLEYVMSTFEDMYSSNPDFVYTKNGFEKFQSEILSYSGSNGVNFILFDNKKRIGYLSLRFEKTKSERNRLIIAKIYINKEYRGRKLGKLLIEKAKEVAIKEKMQSIELNTFQSNLEFYSKMGFKTIAYWMQMKL